MLRFATYLRASRNKFLVIVGPCSADNEDAVCEYTSRLGELLRARFPTSC